MTSANENAICLGLKLPALPGAWGQGSGSVYDALDAEGIAARVEKQVADKSSHYLDAADEDKFSGGKVTGDAENGLFGHAMDRFIRC